MLGPKSVCERHARLGVGEHKLRGSSTVFARIPTWLEYLFYRFGAFYPADVLKIDERFDDVSSALEVRFVFDS